MREERFAGNDQAVMATTCVERPSLCCMVNIIMMLIIMIMMILVIKIMDDHDDADGGDNNSDGDHMC